jgi:hypothetical protein
MIYIKLLNTNSMRSIEIDNREATYPRKTDGNRTVQQENYLEGIFTFTVLQIYNKYLDISN